MVRQATIDLLECPLMVRKRGGQGMHGLKAMSESTSWNGVSSLLNRIMGGERNDDGA